MTEALGPIQGGSSVTSVIDTLVTVVGDLSTLLSLFGQGGSDSATIVSSNNFVLACIFATLQW